MIDVCTRSINQLFVPVSHKQPPKSQPEGSHGGSGNLRICARMDETPVSPVEPKDRSPQLLYTVPSNPPRACVQSLPKSRELKSCSYEGTPVLQLKACCALARVPAAGRWLTLEASAAIQVLVHCTACILVKLNSAVLVSEGSAYELYTQSFSSQSSALQYAARHSSISQSI